MEYRIDCVGLKCPLPLIETQLKVKSMAVGDALSLVFSDTKEMADIKKWCVLKNYQFQCLEQENGCHILKLVKTDD